MIPGPFYLQLPDDPYRSPRRFLAWIGVVLIIGLLYAFAPIVLGLLAVAVSGWLMLGLRREPIHEPRPYDWEVDGVG